MFLYFVKTKIYSRRLHYFRAGNELFINFRLIVNINASCCPLGEDVELNVLDDILGEPAHDEFAAELDKASKGKLQVICLDK